VSITDALRLAQEADLDLVEVAPTARPPVCKLMDYGKFKYESALKARESRKNQAQTVIKEIKIRPKIDPHDYGTKKGHVERFLKQGDKVKVTIMFRGREQSRPELGYKLLQRLAGDVEELGFVESQPKQDGRNMIMVIGPHRKKAETRPVRGQDRASARAAAPSASGGHDEDSDLMLALSAQLDQVELHEPDQAGSDRVEPEQPVPDETQRPAARPVAPATASARPADAANGLAATGEAGSRPVTEQASVPSPARSAAPRPGQAPASAPRPAAPRPGTAAAGAARLASAGSAAPKPGPAVAPRPAAPRPGPAAAGQPRPAAPRPAAPKPGPVPAGAPRPAAPKPSAPRPPAAKPGDGDGAQSPRPRSADNGSEAGG
jgi:translation initiation factor IF-3